MKYNKTLGTKMSRKRSVRGSHQGQGGQGVRGRGRAAI